MSVSARLKIITDGHLSDTALIHDYFLYPHKTDKSVPYGKAILKIQEVKNMKNSINSENVNTCVVCGDIIPEGFMVCNKCGHIKTSDFAQPNNTIKSLKED